MTTSDNLFRLIKSLNRTEKAYFKKFSTLFVYNGESNYVRLFDYMDSLEDHDENKIKEHFKNEKFVKQFSAAKNYLYNSIIRSLKLYGKSEKKRDIAKELIEDAQFLINRRLFSQARKVLKRCRKISEDYEVYSQLLQVLVAESKIAISEREYDEKNDVILNRNYAERKKILKTIKNAFDFDLLEYNITSQISRHRDLQSKKYFKSIEKIMTNSILKKESNAVSLTARLKFNHIHATFNYAAGNLIESYRYLTREIEILTKKPEMLEDRMIDYFILLSNRLLISLELGMYSEFENNLQSFRKELDNKEAAKNNTLKYLVINNSYLIEMSYRNKVGDFEETIRLSEELKRRLLEHGLKMNKADGYWQSNSLAHAFFGIGKFSESLNHLNKLLNDTDAELRFGSISHARVFSLILHYELGNFDLIEYMIRSVYRYLINAGKMRKFEKLVFSFLRKLPDAVNSLELNDKFSELKHQISEAGNDDSVKDALKYFDLATWLESRITEKPFSLLIKESSKSG